MTLFRIPAGTKPGTEIPPCLTRGQALQLIDDCGGYREQLATLARGWNVAGHWNEDIDAEQWEATLADHVDNCALFDARDGKNPSDDDETTLTDPYDNLVALPACEVCGERHDPAKGLSFDGLGINSCDTYRSRIATFERDQLGDWLGRAMAQAPAMRGLLFEAERFLSGFEDDDTQPEVRELLNRMRCTIAQVRA